jgi:Zn-dependent protease
MNPIKHIDPIGTILFPLIAIYTNFPLLGWAKPVPVSFAHLKSPRRDFAIIAAAGPVSNLILAVALALVFKIMGGVTGVVMSPAGNYLIRALDLNVLLAVFNMIPVPPLDGGNVLMGVLPETMARVVDLLRPWGFLILYALLFTGALGSIVLPIADRIIEFLVL